MMSRCLIAIEFALVTCRARVVADEAALLVRAGRGQRRSRSLIRTALPIGRLLPARPNGKYHRSADDQKRRPESPPWKLRSHLPLRFLARLPCWLPRRNSLLATCTNRHLRARNFYRVRRSTGQTLRSHCWMPWRHFSGL